MNWKDFLERLGIDTTSWQWRVRRWQNRRESRKDRVDHRAPQVSQKHKFCEQCGALLERDDESCIRCGAKAPSWQSQKVKRQVTAMLPANNPATMFLLGIILVLGVLQMIPGWGDRVSEGGVWNLLHCLQSGQWYRLVSYGLLHGGLMHLGFNTLALSQVGQVLERQVGSARFFVVYTIAILVSGVGFSVLSPAGTILGASGGLFGMIGFGLSFAHFYGGQAGRAQRNFFIQWAMYGLIFGIVATFSGGMAIANSAHVAGLLVGLVLGWLVERERRQIGRWNKAWKVAAIVCWALTALSIVGIAWYAITVVPPAV